MRISIYMTAGLLLAAFGLQTSCFIKKKATASQISIPEEKPENFPYEIFDTILSTYVNENGRVDYQGLMKDRQNLDMFVAYINKYSPTTDPDLFPTEKDKQAYYINTYNALVLVNVLSRYPVENLDKIKTNFFYQTQFIIGGQSMNLYDLENKIVRPEFEDPRNHFALNCAARGCPKLPAEVFLGERLDEQLDRETKQFVLEERNARVEGDTVYISDIACSFYPEDFVDYEKAKGTNPAGNKDAVISYFNRYRPEDQQLPNSESTKMKCIPYDWTSNDQALSN